MPAPAPSTADAGPPGLARQARVHEPTVLAFDTSTEALALAVSGPSGRHTLMAEGGASASAQLLPQAQRLMSQAGVRLQDLQAVAFGCGPGAFTGLRTACAVAQGLGLGLGLPLLPIDSLLIVAEDARQQFMQAAAPSLLPGQVLDVAVTMDARMQQAYAARYRCIVQGQGGEALTGDWQVMQAPALYDLPTLSQAWAGQPVALLAGSALAAFGEQLQLPQAQHRLPQEHNRAAALLQLALQAWADGLAVDAAEALPLYLRDKVAQTTAERQALRNAQDAAQAGRAAAAATAPTAS